MENLTQEQIIKRKIKQSEARKKLNSAIRKAYELFLSDRSEWNYNDIIILTDRLCRSWVRKSLLNAGCYSADNEETIMQNARMAVWNTLQKTDDVKPAETFPFYAFGIYKIKALDFIKRFCRERKKAVLESIDAPDFGELESEPFEIDRDRIRAVYEGVMIAYCRTFLEMSDPLQNRLALAYSRVLYQLLAAIPDSKITSAKWAFDKMKDLTVLRLTQNSETVLKKDVCQDLAWSEESRGQLNDEIVFSSRSIPLARLVYTDAYNKDKIEDWAETMHKKTKKASIVKVSQDTALMKLIKRCVSDESFLYRYFM